MINLIKQKANEKTTKKFSNGEAFLPRVGNTYITPTFHLVCTMCMYMYIYLYGGRVNLAGTFEG